MISLGLFQMEGDRSGWRGGVPASRWPLVLVALLLFPTLTFCQWQPWENLGGQLGSDPSTVFLNGNLHVFARSSAGTLIHAIQQNGWKWEDAGGKITGEPMCAPVYNDIECFAQGPSGQFLPGINRVTHHDSATEYKQLWHVRWNPYSGWTAWQAVPGLVFSRPSPVVVNDETLKLFSTNKTGSLIENDYNYSTQTFSGWQDQGGGEIGGAASCSSFPTTLSLQVGCFSHDRDGALLINMYKGSWSGWSAVNGAPQASSSYSPSTTTYPHNSFSLPVVAELDVFYEGAKGSLIHGWYDGSKFAFESLQAIFYSGSCIRTDAAKVDCVAKSLPKYELWHGTWVLPGPRIASYVANPMTISPGGKSTLSWNIPDCDPVYCSTSIVGYTGNSPGIVNNDFFQQAMLPRSGTLTVSPSTTASYRLFTIARYQFSVSDRTIEVQTQPPGACSPKGQQTQLATLYLVGTGQNNSVLGYAGTYPNYPGWQNNCNQTVVSFQNPTLYGLLLLAPGHVVDDCVAPNAGSFTAFLGPNQSSSTAILQKVYGTASPRLPVQLTVCPQSNVITSSGVPQAINLAVTFDTP